MRDRTKSHGCGERQWHGAARALVVTALLGVRLPTAHATEALVRTRLANTGDIWVGQRVTIVVELLSPGFFAGSPAFDLPRVPGVIICPPDDRPVVSAETIGASSYSVQRHELAVYAQRAGHIDIPPWDARFATRLGTAAPVQQRLTTRAIAFDVLLPPGAQGLTTVISARDLQATDTWVPEPLAAKVGDAFTRTILFSAPDVPAMLFPAVPTGPVDGLGVYPKTPQVRDANEHGRRCGERVETITYVCERAGQVQIPAMKLTWWDLDDRQLRVAEFPARAFEVAPNPAFEAAVPVPAKRAWWRATRATIGFGLGALVLAGGAWRTRKRWPEWRQHAVDCWSPVHLAPLNPPDPAAPVAARETGRAHRRRAFAGP
ncbi:MAG: hypothetical protein K8T26_01330 [Lentisphaerae bacterium]|nr:hypothetical protein [Lentisphaerota bacterium]